MLQITSEQILNEIKELPDFEKQEAYDFIRFLKIKISKKNAAKEIISDEEWREIFEYEKEFERGETISLDDYLKSRGIHDVSD